MLMVRGALAVCDVRDAPADAVALGSTIVSMAKSAPITTTMASRSTSSLPSAGEAVARACVRHREEQGAIAELGDLGVLAEQNPGEAALAFDLFEHLWPQPAYVGDGKWTQPWSAQRLGPDWVSSQRGQVGGAAARSVCLRRLRRRMA